MAETLIATSPQPQQPVLNFTNVLSESRRLIKSQPCHFLAIFLLFLLPLSVASAVYPALHVRFSNSIVSQNNFLNQTTNSTTLVPDHDQRDQPANIVLVNPHLLILAPFLLHLVLLACAVGSITYTAFHGLHRQPIKPKSIIKSLSTSFFPLLATTLVVGAIILAIGIIFAVSLVSMIIIASLLGFPIDASSSYFTAIGVMMILFFALLVIYLKVNWALAYVVVVTESTWGFEALKRSQTLVKGRRGLVLLLSVVFGFWYVVLERSTSTKYSSLLVTDLDHKRKCLFLSVLSPKIMVTSSFKSLFMIFEMVVKTVMYVYCRSIHDGEKFGDVRLPVDTHHEKVANDGVA